MLKGLRTVALVTDGCPMSVITLLNNERRIGSFFGADQREAMNKSVVGVMMGSSFAMPAIMAEDRQK
jgi:hypothetical protein